MVMREQPFIPFETCINLESCIMPCLQTTVFLFLVSKQFYFSHKNIQTMSSYTTASIDSSFFRGFSPSGDKRLSPQHNSSLNNSDQTSSYSVEFVLGNELRVGKYCMINGHPCKIRDLNRSAPGKHGHAKLRTVGIGVFDGKKRETIFIAQQVVSVPSTVETKSDIVCVTTKNGFQQIQSSTSVAEDSNIRIGRLSLPSLISFPDELSDLSSAVPAEGEYAILTLIATCGYHKIKSIKTVSSLPNKILTNGEESYTDEKSKSVGSTVLSRKEQRKQKKLLRKQQSISPEETKS